MTMTMTDHASIGAYDQTHLLSATDYYIKTRSSSSLTLGNERGLIEIGQQLKIVRGRIIPKMWKDDLTIQ
jgi:hypothetical protein